MLKDRNKGNWEKENDALCLTAHFIPCIYAYENSFSPSVFERPCGGPSRDGHGRKSVFFLEIPLMNDSEINNVGFMKSLIILISTIIIGVGCSKPLTSLDYSQKRKTVATSQKSMGLLLAFKKATGVDEDIYIAIRPDSHPELCLEGDLELFRIDDSLSVLIGDRLLVGWIKKGENEVTYSERACRFHRIVNWSNNKVESFEKRVCKDETVIVEKSFEFKKDTISYSIDLKLNGKDQERISCKLERQ